MERNARKRSRHWGAPPLRLVGGNFFSFATVGSKVAVLYPPFPESPDSKTSQNHLPVVSFPPLGWNRLGQVPTRNLTLPAGAITQTWRESSPVHHLLLLSCPSSVTALCHRGRRLLRGRGLRREPG